MNIHTQERAVFDWFLDLAPLWPDAHAFLASLGAWQNHIQDKSRYKDAPFYRSIVAQLPTPRKVRVSDGRAGFWLDVEMDASEFKKTHALLARLMPWRKGPFGIKGKGEIFIDTEWRSDLKWERISRHLNLAGKRVLDVGGGSGYHAFCMARSGADAIVADPSPLFYHQFLAINHFARRALGSSVHYLPVPLDALPASHGFDVVFCMGVLYHRISPFDTLSELKDQLAPSGTLVLETLVIEGDAQAVLVPNGRYAMMNNVYFLPSVAALTLWLQKAGFVDVVCVDVSITQTSEQRATDWMRYHSLKDFLHPDNPTKTLEGYPRPMRAMLMARRP